MEESAIGKDECDRSESTPVSKSIRPLNDLRSKEFVNACEKLEVGKCGHFSIRGYVSEIREKDIEFCWPFTIRASDRPLVLPPLDVPEFRWWGCQNCLKRNDAIGESTETDSPKLLSGVQHASKECIFEGRKIDADANINVNGDECDPSLYGDKKGMEAAVVHPIRDGIKLSDILEVPSLYGDKKGKEAAAVHPIRDDIFTFEGHDNGAEDNVSQEIYGTSCAATNVKPCLTGETVTNEAGKTNVNVNTDNQGCNSSAPKSVCYEKHQREDPNVVTSHANKLHSMELDTDSHGCNLSGCETAISSKPVCLDKRQSEDPNVAVGHTSKLISAELDESDCQFFRNDENIVRNVVQDEHCAHQHGNSSGTFRRRKIRKVRFLSDILRSDALGMSGQDAKTDYIKPEIAHSKAAQDASTGTGLHSDPTSLVDVTGNDKNVILCKKRKWKMPQDEDEGEDEGALQMSFPKVVPETVGIFKGDAETRDINTTIVHSESAADTSENIGFPPGLKSFLNELQNDKQYPLDKTKMMPQFEVGESSLMPCQESIPRVQILGRDVENSGAEIVPSKSAQDAFTGIDQLPDPKSSLTAKSNGKKITLVKNKSVNSQVEDGQPSLRPLKEGMTENDQIMRDVGIKNKGAGTIPYRSVHDAFHGGGVHHGVSHSATNRKAIMSKKQKSKLRVEGGVSTPHIEEEGPSLFCQPEASSGAHNYENPNVQGNPELLKNQSNQRAKTVSEQATLDDIPMDIVELMAKNQHERRLFNAESTTKNSYCMSGTTEKAKGADQMNSSDVLGSEMLRLLRGKNSHMQKTQSSNEGTGMCATGKRVASTEWKPNGYTHHVSSNYNRINFSINQPRQTHPCVGFASFSPSWKKPSTGARVTDIGSIRSRGNQSFNWNGDMVGHRFSQTCLPSSEAYPTQKVLQQISCQEDHHDWSPTILNRKPFGFDSPQKFAAESSNGKPIPQCLELFPTGDTHRDLGPKSMNPNDIHCENQKRKFDLEANKRAQPEYPFTLMERGNYQSKMMEPLDLYAKETIPALDLLRLMDAGVSSGTTAHAIKNQKFAKQPPFPHDHHHKSGFEIRPSQNGEAMTYRPSSYCFDKNHRLGKSSEHFPSFPKLDLVGSSCQKDHNFTRATGSRNNFSAKLLSNSFKSLVKEKTKSKKAPTQPRGLTSHSSVSRYDSAAKYHQFHDQQKGLLSASDSLSSPILSQPIELDLNKKCGPVWPGTSSCGTDICSVNRNPADFSVPEAENVYTIGPGDLKNRKMISSRDRSGPIDRDGHKRQKMMKLTAIQEHVQN